MNSFKKIISLPFSGGHLRALRRILRDVLLESQGGTILKFRIEIFRGKRATFHKNEFAGPLPTPAGHGEGGEGHHDSLIAGMRRMAKKKKTAAATLARKIV